MAGRDPSAGDFSHRQCYTRYVKVIIPIINLRELHCAFLHNAEAIGEQPKEIDIAPLSEWFSSGDIEILDDF